MKSIKYILISIIAIFLFNSCEYEIDYNGVLPKDKLVVASFIQADSVISISLFKSAKPGTYARNDYYEKLSLNKNDIRAYVPDAKAELFINGELKQTLNSATTSNKYIFSVIPRENENVEVRFSYKDFDQAVGNAKLNLLKPAIDSISLLIHESINNYGERINKVVVYLEIRDDGRENYYQIESELYYEEAFDVYTLLLEDAEVLWENVPGVYKENTANLESSSNRYGVFSNKLFKGSTYKVKLAIPVQSFGPMPFPKIARKAYGSVSVSTIDKKSHDYLFTLNRYFNASFMNEPVIIIDGVENAYGFIGAKKTRKINNLRIDYD